MRKRFLAVAATLAALLLFWMAPFAARSQAPEVVVVSNLPDVVAIKGDVRVLGTVYHSKMIRRLEVIVPPVSRQETDSLIEVEAVDTGGFTTVALSLQGDVRGILGRGGVVGAVLIPDEEPILETLRQDGIIQLPVEVTAGLSRKEETKFSAQAHLTLGFPRYKVFLYNSTDRTVDVNLYVYLTN